MTSYALRISDWSSYVCSSDPTRGRIADFPRRRPARALTGQQSRRFRAHGGAPNICKFHKMIRIGGRRRFHSRPPCLPHVLPESSPSVVRPFAVRSRQSAAAQRAGGRSEEHTSELQSLMRISYAVFCLKKKKKDTQQIDYPKKNKKTTKSNNRIINT